MCHCQRLNNRDSFKAIANTLGKDCTTISEEVKKHITISQTGCSGRVYNNCFYRSLCFEGERCEECTYHRMKNRCRSCNKCNFHFTSFYWKFMDSDGTFVEQTWHTQLDMPFNGFWVQRNFKSLTMQPVSSVHSCRAASSLVSPFSIRPAGTFHSNAIPFIV